MPYGADQHDGPAANVEDRDNSQEDESQNRRVDHVPHHTENERHQLKIMAGVANPNRLGDSLRWRPQRTRENSDRKLNSIAA